jgi:Phosphotransferase enzyme family
VTGRVEQLRVWELSCILRAPTVHGDVYLKATRDSPLFVNEAVVTRELAALFPDQVPAPLAVDAERRWMALADFGVELGWDAPVEVREDALRTFAGLQVRAAPQVDRLLAAGCLDRRLDRLAAQAERWLPAVGDTGRLPGIDDATWLSADEVAGLRAAAPRPVAMCGELAASAVPATLVHGDLHLSNVARGRRGYVFFDWTDACVAHPFLDLPAFFQGDEEEVDDALRDRLRDAYLAEWTRFESPDRLRRTWGLAEPLGALHHAVSYRSLVANPEPPIDAHMTRSTAWWLRKVLAGLRQLTGG